jgi:hypothetical protein
MLVAELIAKLQKLPQDAEFVIWHEDREVYVGVEADPDIVELGRNRHNELVDLDENDENKGEICVTVGMQI